MILDETGTTTNSPGSTGLCVDLEFEHYLFEVFLNDRIENEIQRMMELERVPEATIT